MSLDAVVTGASTGIGRGGGQGSRRPRLARFRRRAQGRRRRIAAPGIRRPGRAAAVRRDRRRRGSARRRGNARQAWRARPSRGWSTTPAWRLGGPLAHQPIDQIRRVFEVNALGPAAVSQAFIPLLGADRSLSGGAGANRQHHLGRRADRGAVPRRLRDVEARARGVQRQPASRIDRSTASTSSSSAPASIVTPIWDKAEASDDFGLRRNRLRADAAAVQEGVRRARAQGTAGRARSARRFISP